MNEYEYSRTGGLRAVGGRRDVGGRRSVSHHGACARRGIFGMTSVKMTPEHFLGLVQT